MERRGDGGEKRWHFFVESWLEEREAGLKKGRESHFRPEKRNKGDSKEEKTASTSPSERKGPEEGTPRNVGKKEDLRSRQRRENPLNAKRGERWLCCVKLGGGKGGYPGRESSPTGAGVGRQMKNGEGIKR